MNSRYLVTLTVHYKSGLSDKSAEFFGWGENAGEARDDAELRRYNAPDGAFIQGILSGGCRLDEPAPVREPAWIYAGARA